MKAFDLTYRQFGVNAILIEWPQIITEETLRDIQSFQAVIQHQIPSELEETVPAYASLTLFFNHIQDKDEIIKRLKELYHKKINNDVVSHIWHIPVCYDQKFGLDLAEVSKKTNLNQEEIVHAHSSKPYLIHFIGFLPGFLYLGGLEEKLHCPRKENPRFQVSKGSVGIGASQTGIYPIESPGGWNIIGNSPVSFFDKEQPQPCFAKPGDKIKFMPIDAIEHASIVKEVENGRYSIKPNPV